LHFAIGALWNSSNLTERQRSLDDQNAQLRLLARS
jgi:hypothetical protein